jgi:branched-chain amino acid transport system substrate-binding protein
VVNVPAPAADYFTGALDALQQARAGEPGLRTLALLHAATGFGREVARGAQARALQLGLPVQVREFAPGQAAASASGLPAADILLVAGGFEDELAAARVLLPRSAYRAAGFVGAGVDEVLAPLGAAREGLLGPCQWLAEVAPPPAEPGLPGRPGPGSARDRPGWEGPDAAWFSRRYLARTGRPPSYPAAQAFAAGLLAARCARGAFGAGRPVSDAALLAQARGLRCTTLYGAFALDPDSGRQRGHQLLTVQWQGGRRVAVWPPPLAQARLELRA